ncbi:MAG: putative DNA-binding domain-containing protein [Planctomycetaceae bacterium]|nr:putative DNA-binding domain-containing protein [Planctomycetaceae bacterium]
MNQPKSIFSLPVLQQWMQLVITHPDGVEEGIHSSEAQAQLAIHSDALETVIPRSEQLTSLERLQVYGNAYYARLIDCLGVEFPALKEALGEETFSGFVFTFLQSYPSTSYTLDDLGRNFPQFLEETRPADIDQSWPDFLIDLARLERTYAEVFDGPGMETEPGLDVAELASIPSEDWNRLCLKPAPCLRLLELSHPVHLYATAVKKEEQPSLPTPEKTWLVVFRSEYVVRRRAVEETQFRLLQALVDGQPLGRALESTFPKESESTSELQETLRDWFTFWAKWRFFAGYRLDEL